MEKKQKTLSLLMAVMLGTGTTAQAQTLTSQLNAPSHTYRQAIARQHGGQDAASAPSPTIDMQPVLTQIPHQTQAPTEAPILTQQPLPDPTPIATAAPTHVPVATPLPTATPEKTQTPQPTATAAPKPTATAAPQPEATRKPVVATPAPSTDEDYTTGYVGMQEEIAFLLLNNDRAANGMPPLQLDPALCSIARLKCEDMKNNRYFAHNSPTYGSPSQMLTKLGYTFSAAGENIAHHATVEKSQAAFMSSAGHRKNILSSSWTKVGIGVVTDAQGFVYVTQLFVR